MKDGKRAIGTKMDNPAVLETVLKKGELLDTWKLECAQPKNHGSE
jgi:hypothetical protein